MKHSLRWLFGALISACMLVPHMVVQAAPHMAIPQAAMLVIAADDTRRLTLDLGDARAPEETLDIPAGAVLTPRMDAPLPALVQQLIVPSTTQNYLLFKGEPTATPAPTQTPYVPRAGASFTVQPPNRVQTEMSALGARFVDVTCATCQPGWEVSLLNQLPVHAPIVVYAPGAVQMNGAWLIHIMPVSDADMLQLGAVAHLFERLPDQQIAAPTWRNGRVSEATYPPKRRVEVDGRATLARIVFCLVAVLFCSLASFYMALAVMRRMHAAVGYKPEQ